MSKEKETPEEFAARHKAEDAKVDADGFDENGLPPIGSLWVERLGGKRIDFTGAVITQLPVASCTKLVIEVMLDNTDPRVAELQMRLPYALTLVEEAE